jgi:hypothetical protein
VAYVFQRGQRTTIGLSVGVQGLSVRAPRWATLAAVDEVLQHKADWVLRKLAQAGQRHQTLQHERMTWGDGTRLAWLGRHLTLRQGLPPAVDPGAAPDAIHGMALPTASAAPRRRTQLVPVQCVGDELWVALPAEATDSAWPAAVQAWMAGEALRHFEQRLNHFAPLLQVKWTRLGLSNASTRWGSAKADGSIRLHWRLMQFDTEVLDYVVAHELSHLRHMDHSPRFWQTVATVVPDHTRLRARLRGTRLSTW